MKASTLCSCVVNKQLNVASKLLFTFSVLVVNKMVVTISVYKSYHDRK